MMPRELLLEALFWSAIFWVAVAILYQVAAFCALFFFLRRKTAPLKRTRPRCTFLRPLKGMNAAKAANLDALCRCGVPVVTGIQDRWDPALGMALQAKARHVKVPISIRVGVGPSAPTGRSPT
ncbi:MAG: hypothetical protein HY717_13445 [Planctomycetes bacterium]|nr:hypothetical protein [Planctomycetota bacterium]